MIALLLVGCAHLAPLPATAPSCSRLRYAAAWYDCGDVLVCSSAPTSPEPQIWAQLRPRGRGIPALRYPIAGCPLDPSGGTSACLAAAIDAAVVAACPP